MSGDVAEPQPFTLQPVLGPRYALGLRHVLVCALFGGMLIYLNLLHLWYTDLWSHVAYGQWILNHRALPVFEPFMPLASGERVINYCWLSQVIFALAERAGGAEALSNLFALVVVARYMVMARTCYLQTGRLSLALGGMLAGFLFGWVRNPIMRPEIFAGLCGQCLLWELAALDPESWQRPVPDTVPRSGWRLRTWLLTPLLFVAWVNFHSSYLMGLVILGAHALGRVVAVAWVARRLDLRQIARDPEVRRWTALTVLCALATLVNPSGWRILLDSIRISGNPNLKTVAEWLPLTPTGLGARLFAASWGLLVVVLRLSKRPVRPVEAILLAVFALGVLQSGRVILWYTMVYVYVVLPHVAEIANRLWPVRAAAERARGEPLTFRSFRYTLICLAVVWGSFALSHLSDRLLGAEARAPESLYTPSTPRGVADYLIAHPPAGQVWNSQAVGDWITWAWLKHYGPDKPLIKLMTNTHMHVIPRQVWVDYQNIGLLRPGWRELLAQYQIDTLVMSKVQHYVLCRDIREIPGWTIQYEDENGMVVTRDSEPAPADKATHR